MDILDATVINFQIKITCRFAHNVNKYELISKIQTAVKKLYTKEKMVLGKPIIVSNIRSVVQRLTGVISVVDVKLVNVSGTILNRSYSDTAKNLDLALDDDIYFSEPYEIFELRYPNQDILVTVK